MNIVTFSLKDLIPYANNPRNNKEAVKYVAESIKEFGFKVPLVIDKDNVIVTGHTRYLAAKKLGIDKVPCIVANDLSEEQIKAYRLADNKTAEQAEWDLDLLDIELNNIFDIDMDLFGFEDLIEEDEEAEEVASKKDDTFFYFDKEEIQQNIIDGWQIYSSVEEYVKNIIDVPTAKYQYNRLCQGYNDGYNISLLFNPHRLETETIKSKSIMYAINNDDNYKKQYARYILNVTNKVVVPNQYYKFIGIGHASYQYVNEFPPYLARDIYKMYCKEGSKVLNPCAGWGGRLLGITSCQFNDIEYIETDPSTKTYEGLLKLKAFLNADEEKYKTYNLPFECLELQDNYFDFAFTSPPYFDTERYADEKTQSYQSNDNYDEWKHNFLYVMLDKIHYALKIGGICLLNVGKVRYPIDEDIIEYMQDKYNLKCKRVKNFKIGGDGIGARTDDSNDGEPFLEFRKKVKSK